jgi:hypothetical protein
VQGGVGGSGCALAAHGSGQGEKPELKDHHSENGPPNPNLWRRQSALNGFHECRADLMLWDLGLRVHCPASQEASRSLD